MKTLIVYYSRTGNNARLAEQLHERVESEIDRIIDAQATNSRAKDAFRALFKRTTAIEFAQDPGDYDQVVVVTPFWVGSLPPATRTYLKEHRNRLERFPILSICGRGAANKQAMPDVEATAGREPFASLLIEEAAAEHEGSQRRVDAFVQELLA